MINSSQSSGMVRLAEVLSWAALLLVATVILLLVLMEKNIAPSSELVASVSLLAGLLAPVLAVVSYCVTKLYGSRVSRVTVMALLLGAIVFLWPALLIVAFTNCPGGLC